MKTSAAASDPVDSFVPYEDRFLSWFSGQGIPMLELKLQLGGLDYFHFTSFLKIVDGSDIASFGSAVDRKLAALKCAGEAVERMAMAEFFAARRTQFPKAVRNSNGWAAQFSAEKAKAGAINEALERHLLLKSFFTYSWDGFNWLQDIDSGDMKLRLLTSRFISGGKVAGIVAAQSPKFPGVSFGYTAGALSSIDRAEFWHSAVFEAADKFLLLQHREPGAADTSGKTWLRREIDHFLNNPFNLDLLGKCRYGEIETDIGPFEIHCTDLSQTLNLSFPLFAAYAHGGNLIPLFAKTELDHSSMGYVKPILIRNGIDHIPDRHPIL